MISKEVPGVPCEGRPTEGQCDKRITGISFDTVSKTCKEYVGSGCRGTKNLFRDMEECEAKCSKFLIFYSIQKNQRKLLQSC